MTRHTQNLLPGWYGFGREGDAQTPFEVAVVMPTVGRDSILDAVASVYAQRGVGRIQLLIGVDAPLGDLGRLQELLAAAPEHVTPFLFHPGYSTSVRHGGLHPARDGGALRTVLSYMANAPHLAYLDDDNWWGPDHLRQLLDAIAGRDWAFALRWFVHPDSGQPVCIDDWESTGPGRGLFAQKFGGWVDPNCLMIDKMKCEPVLRWWSIPLPGDPNAMSADRHVFHWLQQRSAPGETAQASVFYAMQPKDELHSSRLAQMGARYPAAATPVKAGPPRMTAIIACRAPAPQGMQTLGPWLQQPLLDVILVDCDQPRTARHWLQAHPEPGVIDLGLQAPCTPSHARNAAARAARTPWLLFLDADALPGQDFAPWLQQGLRAGHFHVEDAGEPASARMLACSRTAFQRSGGYDEALEAWGGETGDLCHRLALAGEQAARCPPGLLAGLPAASRTAGNPDTLALYRRWYHHIRQDLQILRGKALGPAEARTCSTLVQQAVDKGMEGNGIPDIFLDLDEGTDLDRLAGLRIERRLTYRLSRRKAAPSTEEQI